MNNTGISHDDARRIIEEGGEEVTPEDLKKVLRQEKKIKRKLSGPLGKFVDEARTLFELIRDYWNKRYTEVPWWTIGAAATSLLYILDPMDIVPDFIPGIGLLDDASVLSVCLFMIRRDLEKYTAWKADEAAVEEVSSDGI